MAVTLADVAARAGVSAATVSRVLSGNYPVAAHTRGRVLRAVEELEYVVNGPASALAAASSDLVGVLVNDIADPFFGIIASAVQSEIGDRKLPVVCNTGGSPERELTYLTLLQRQRAAAVVVTGSAVEDPEHQAALAARLQRLTEGGARVVLCGRPPMGGSAAGGGTAARGAGAGAGTGTGTGAAETAGAPGGPAPAADGGIVTLAFDNTGGARRLTEHLLSLGHRRIGYVAGPADRTTTRHRLDGHRQALEARGLLADAELLTVHGCAYDRPSGYDGALELLRRGAAPTAVLAANDTVALGVCAALREQGLRVPEDISVAGFDDFPYSVDAHPALTTVRIPLHSAGARAGRLALGREGAPPGGVATVPAELIVRASTAPPHSFP
ncbi:LacI family transcriptional regulator [Streptomyces armeniacus]|uniref:LacI family transcriptional regulator n=1 Tax=Streptomyces armeniacus TaxID=83291 RepID=A0A345XNR2_9ACTN|nr:LacI family DNA-binding transcriptional regulator [Streptomyces armeniacus]AXK33278.1 LacI family transcriptional regulator [Streptomyces armeniacus]